MAWSIFQQGGGPGAALTWARDLLQSASSQWGANVDTPGNEQFIYDWELSEGGGGANNPLNQGPVPGQPQLTTTGEQYGGGAADFASVSAGIQGAIDYLDMNNYSGIKAGLIANDPAAARSALIASPWASSHYNNGASFATAPAPGQANAITGGATTVQTTAATTGINLDPLDLFGIPSTIFGSSGVTGDIIGAGSLLLALGVGAALVVAGVFKTASPGRSVTETVGGDARQAGELAALA